MEQNSSNQSPFQVRPAGKDDWKMVRDTRLRALADSPDAFGTTLAEDESRADKEWMDRVMDPAVSHFLAVDSDDNPVGMAVGAPYIGAEEAAGLFGMWVAPEVRGKGIGGLLVDAVIDWARAGSYSRILLDVADENLNATRLYASKGFLATGRTSTLPSPREHIEEHERCLPLD